MNVNRSIKALAEGETGATRPGESYATGLTISGQHCGGCGRPDSTKQRYSETRVEPLATTPCCGRLPCHGHVTTAPWIGRRTGRETWACCLGVAERALGEPARLSLGHV